MYSTKHNAIINSTKHNAIINMKLSMNQMFLLSLKKPLEMPSNAV